MDIPTHDKYGHYYMPVTVENLNDITSGHKTGGFFAISDFGKPDDTWLGGRLRDVGIGYVPVVGFMSDGTERKAYLCPCLTCHKEETDFDETFRKLLGIGAKFRQRRVLVCRGKDMKFVNPLLGGDDVGIASNLDADADLEKILCNFVSSLGDGRTECVACRFMDHPGSMNEAIGRRYSGEIVLYLGSLKSKYTTTTRSRCILVR